MREGKVTGWLVPEGARVKVGDEILEVETDKIAGVVEATDAGVLRRRVGEPDSVYPVKALLGVLAEEGVSEAVIDAYVAAYVTPSEESGEEEESLPRYEFVDLDNWLFNIDPLAEQATVYALDLPGHGQSEKHIADPSVAGLADAALAFLDALAIDQAHLVGHSLGGAVAIELARRPGGRARSLSLIASAGLGPEINADYIGGFVSAASRRELKPVVEQLFADPSLVTRQLVDDLLKYKRLDGVAEALGSLAKGAFAGGTQQALLADALAEAGLPTLVLWGKEDRIIPAAHAEVAKGARIVILEEAGHMVQMEAAGKVNALLKEQIGG
jgi:pyruvate dehydrogenase E2 component (dihydrolipoamide acetyltransferase)